ncbi:MAG: hypothetical protein LBP59_02960 [Planctomycetaceae bacterium]|nr:hypothetical protein [Planctomycetaceae bacterium]
MQARRPRSGGECDSLAPAFIFLQARRLRTCSTDFFKWTIRTIFVTKNHY